MGWVRQEVKHLQSKIKSGIGFLFGNKASFPHAAKHSFVKLTILPILDFGDVIYKITPNTLLSKLNVVYHRAIRLITKAPYTTQHCDLYALIGWPSLHILRQTHWLQVIYKSLLGKALPYLSSLVTIATPAHSTHSSRYIALVIPKANTSFGHRSFQFSAANDWNKLQSWSLISPSLTLSISCQSSLPITEPVHSQSVNSTPNYLIPILLLTLLLFCTPVSLLAHHHLYSYNSSINAKL